MKTDAPSPTRDFSLVLGGPLFQLYRRAFLADDALRLVRRRVLVLSLLAWLPLAVLAAGNGNFWNSGGPLPLLKDLEVHFRFLVAMPLLIVAELVVHGRMSALVRQFLERNLIPEEGLERFQASIASALRLRNSVLAEVLLIAFVYGFGIEILWRHYMALSTPTWYATPDSVGLHPSLAGYWYGFVSLPLFQFLLLRWYYRLAIWTRFLWQVSRIPLQLVPTHPDGMAGLGFLASTVEGFAPVLVAHGALLAGQLSVRIVFLGANLPDFKVEIAVVILFLLCLMLGPLLFFSPQLFQSKLRGKAEYGTLAQRYVREFDQKWLRGGAPADEPLVGSADIQSLADLGNSYEVVKTMRTVIFTKDSILLLLGATVIPLAPLLLTMMPLEELMKKLLSIVF